jgi:osmotically-inducible protein OsmY
VGKTKDIREAVEAELDFDPLIDDGGISVKNMSGEVALNGTVPSFPQYQEATAAAQRIQGVTSVHNHLEVVLPPESYRDDTTLTTMANNALTVNISVPATVDAIASNGNIMLSGTVRYASGRRGRTVRRLAHWRARHPGRDRHRLGRGSGGRHPQRPGGAGPQRADP